jgi:UPF0716 protein FxsA
MGLLVLVVLVAWPVTELYVASLVAGQIGWGLTLLVLVALSGLGVLVLRSSGRAWRAVAAGAAPAPGTTVPAAGTGAAAMDAGFQLMAGLLLLVPGFVTASLGLLLLVPPFRVLAVALLGRWLVRRFPTWQSSMTRIRVWTGGDVVQGQVVRPDDEPPGPATGPRGDGQPPQLS